MQTSEPIKDFKAMAGRRPQIVIFKLDDTFSFGDDYTIANSYGIRLCTN